MAFHSHSQLHSLLRYDWNTGGFTAACAPDPKLLYRKRLLVQLVTRQKSRRQLLFHQGEERPTILRRHCAVWNDGIGR